MAYVAVRGGEEAIAASLELVRERLVLSGNDLEVATIRAALPELIDQVMGESSLYDPTLAALAIKQGGGSVEEAVFLLRAFRSTLERPYVSCVIDTADMRVCRRISAAFKDIPGGQVLGASRDYSHRLLDFSLGEWEEDFYDFEENGERADPCQFTEGAIEETPGNQPLFAGGDSQHIAAYLANSLSDTAGGFSDLGRVSAYLKTQGLLPAVVPDDTPPHDATMEPLSFPAPRSVRLQTRARGMTQAVMALGYAAIRGFGPAHPTVGELRQGSVAVHIAHPFEPGGEQDVYYVGSLRVTEVESLFEIARPKGHGLEFGIGYGLVYGHAESKAIAMSVLDHCLSLGDKQFPVQDEEFVLYHVDGVEATGFISHLKLPHYVTFRSKLDSTRRTQTLACKDAEPEGDGEPGGTSEPDGAGESNDTSESGGTGEPGEPDAADDANEPDKTGEPDGGPHASSL
jgi:alpha-D-ribose 1-methylphosphonate 5-triphosphate synthase subunit PhnI